MLLFLQKMSEPDEYVKIYTDGSCHTQLLVGAWVSMIMCDGDKIILQGIEENTSHNRMELRAVINALNHLRENGIQTEKVVLYSDSQYVVGLRHRLVNLMAKSFRTKAGKVIGNADLMREFADCINKQKVEFVKVKAHKKDGDILNREVDLLVRQMLRKEIKKNELGSE